MVDTRSGILEVRSQEGGGTDYQFEATSPDDTMRFWVPGEAFPRITLSPGGVRVGDGTVAPALIGSERLIGTATWNPPLVAAAATESTTVTVAGAAVGDPAVAGFSHAVVAGAFLAASVTAADTVTVTLVNLTAGDIDLASGTLTAQVWHD